MAAIHKGSPKIRFDFAPAKRQSVLGGLPAVEALAQEFGLWSKLKALDVLDPRTRKGRGFGADAMVAQLIYCFVSGGASLADAERLEPIRWRGSWHGWSPSPMRPHWESGCAVCGERAGDVETDRRVHCLGGEPD